MGSRPRPGPPCTGKAGEGQPVCTHLLVDEPKLGKPRHRWLNPQGCKPRVAAWHLNSRTIAQPSAASIDRGGPRASPPTGPLYPVHGAGNVIVLAATHLVPPARDPALGAMVKMVGTTGASTGAQSSCALACASTRSSATHTKPAIGAGRRAEPRTTTCQKAEAMCARSCTGTRKKRRVASA